jgi:hypothetical protein
MVRVSVATFVTKLNSTRLSSYGNISRIKRSALTVTSFVICKKQHNRCSPSPDKLQSRTTNSMIQLRHVVLEGGHKDTRHRKYCTSYVNSHFKRKNNEVCTDCCNFMKTLKCWMDRNPPWFCYFHAFWKYLIRITTY